VPSLLLLVAVAAVLLLRDRQVRRLRAMLGAIGAALVETTASGRILSWNDAATALFGYPAAEAHGRLLGDLLLAPELGSASTAQLDVARKDGSRFPLDVRVAPGAHGRLVVACYDATERVAREEHLAEQAMRDPLTGLANREAFRSRLDAALRSSRPDGGSIAVLLIDLDDFKLINDTHGHPTGDRVLAEAAKRIREVVRAEDVPARLGGDEFALLLHNGAAAGDVARRLAEAFREPVALDARRFSVRASVGAVVSNAADPSETADQLISEADIAMYSAKEAGRDGWVLLTGPARAHAVVQTFIRERIARPELEHFHVVYQPIVDLTNGTIRGAEALLRWHHPDIGDIPPGLFIPLAEQAGSIGLLGEFVLAEALRQLAAWADEHPRHRLSMGINLSARQITDPQLPLNILGLLARHHLPPDRLVLEITEQSVLVDFPTARSVLHELRSHGVAVAIDDFGTGYSSLRYLDNLPPDILKIDRDFVEKASRDARSAALVRSVLQMGAQLDMVTVAEGVQTATQAITLRDLGCQYAQGYLFSHAIPADAFGELIANGTTYDVYLGTPGLPRLPRQQRSVARDASRAVGEAQL
jgi:diguanylate cyclase (GGDEF)-like protein/PAS domain S-box-containing protein